MQGFKNDIIIRLKKDILPLQGFKTLSTDNSVDIGFRPIEGAFPNGVFPIGCIHEIVNTPSTENAAGHGFIAYLLSKLMQRGGASIWISASRTLFPVALKIFGVAPDQIIFIDLKKEKDLLPATEEALQCNMFTSVISEVNKISFKESRRLQLAAEQSRVTGFLIHQQLNPIACISRWRITSCPSQLIEGMPGVGFPRWKVELLKVRNGKPGSWTVEWSPNGLMNIRENIASLPQQYILKTG